MGLFDKLKFWKHEDLDLGLESDLGSRSDMGMPSEDKEAFPSEKMRLEKADMGGFDTGMPPPTQPDMGEEPMSGTEAMQAIKPPKLERVEPAVDEHAKLQQHSIDQKLELLSAKMDNLKASMDIINQRLANIERTKSNESW